MVPPLGESVAHSSDPIGPSGSIKLYGHIQPQNKIASQVIGLGPIGLLIPSLRIFPALKKCRSMSASQQLWKLRNFAVRQLRWTLCSDTFNEFVTLLREKENVSSGVVEGDRPLTGVAFFRAIQPRITYRITTDARTLTSNN